MPVYILSIMIYRLILLLLPFSFLSAQIKTKEISSFEFTQTRSIEFFEGHLFMEVGHNVRLNGVRDSVFLYKLDLDLKVIDSALLNSYITSTNPFFLNVGEFSVIDSSLVISLGYTTGDTSLGCWESESALLFLDADLNLRKKIVIPSGGNQLLIFNQTAIESGILFSGSHYSCSTFTLSPAIGLWDEQLDTVYYKLTQNFDSLNPRSLEARDPTLMDGKILCNVYPASAAGMHSSTIVLDTNLNLLSLKSARDPNFANYHHMHSHSDFIKSNSGLKQLGISRSWPDGLNFPGGLDGYFNLAIASLDSNLNVNQIDTFPLSGYDFSTSLTTFSGHGVSIDSHAFRTKDSVFVVLGKEYVNFLNYIDSDPTSFFIYSLNLNTNTVNWSRQIFRNGTAGEHSVTALPGNRLAIAFNENDSAQYSGYDLRVHVWILDEVGNVISNKSFKENLQYSVYPNPASEQLKIANLTKDLPYAIVTLDGQQVKKGTVLQESASIDISSLKEGIYLLLLDKSSVNFQVMK